MQDNISLVVNNFFRNALIAYFVMFIIVFSMFTIEGFKHQSFFINKTAAQSYWQTDYCYGTPKFCGK